MESAEMIEPAGNTVSAEQTLAAFDLLGLFSSIVLPSAVISHMDPNTRKLLRLCCKRLRVDVDENVTSIAINRYNIAKLQPTVPGSLARRYPRIRRLAFGANEPRDVTALLRAQLPTLAPSLECLDFWSYYASVSTDLWTSLVELAPPSLRLRLNINESLLRRMEMVAVLAALAALRAARPGLVVEFNTGHTSFGFRSTEPETLRFLASADYVHSMGFSIGLHGRELQNHHFFQYIARFEAVAAIEATASPLPPSCLQPSAAAGSIQALSLAHYEAAERPPIGPLLHGIHLLTSLCSLTLDCEISLLELAPLSTCCALTQLTVDLLTARLQAPQLPPPMVLFNPGGPAVDVDGPGGVAGGGGGDPPWRSGLGAAVAPALPQVRSLTLGTESHPAQPLAEVFPGLTELVCVPCTRNVGVYNAFHCGSLLEGASNLERLTLSCVVEAEEPSILARATALTALAFTHTDNASTAGLLAAAAVLPRLRRLALWDHEDAEEFLKLAVETDLVVKSSESMFSQLEELEVRATSPEFFDEIATLLMAGSLKFGTTVETAGRLGGCGLRRARLEACYDPPLLRVRQLGALLASLGSGLCHAVVSGWATPGSEAAILQLGRDIGRPGLVMEYEYPIL